MQGFLLIYGLWVCSRLLQAMVAKEEQLKRELREAQDRVVAELTLHFEQQLDAEARQAATLAMRLEEERALRVIQEQVILALMRFDAGGDGE